MSEQEEQPKPKKQRIEKNPKKDVILRKHDVVPHPYNKGAVSESTTTVKIGTTVYKDTGGGFLLLQESDEQKVSTVSDIPQPEAPIIEPDRPNCEICDKPFATSWLFDKFSHKCCDNCKDPETHKLITKTEAKDTYLLKDCDFDKRGPELKFIKQKNPHNTNWKDMKLYLQLQVEKRALEIWGSLEKIDEEKEKRQDKRDLAKAKQLKKHLNELRKNMRSSLFVRTSATSHVHSFDDEIYNEEDDTYFRKCTTCPYEETFEKM